RFTRRMEMGGDQMTRRIQGEMNLSYDDAEKLKRDKGMKGEENLQALLKSEADRFIVEVQRSVDYYRAQFREGIFKKIILMGGGALLSGFSEYFATYFDSRVEIDDPFLKIIGGESAGSIRAIGPRFSTTVGLGLRRDL
ncbi:MAG TPA: pilus assembly protein PilM, partial [Candidatus Manganitrophaceae bacterium]|nr:pilus assembly protein PilM [Candidatus Manganitrophaceae bacterium]